MIQSYLRNIYLRLAGVVMLVVICALAASSVLSHRTLEHTLTPHITTKAATTGALLRSLILKAADNGIEFENIYGVNQKFDEVIGDIPEVNYLALTNTQGKVLTDRTEAGTPPAQTGNFFRQPEVLALLKTPDAIPPAKRLGNHYFVSLPIVSPKGPLGMLHIGVDVRFVDDIVLDLALDVLVVLVVALFFTLELLHFMAGSQLETALRSLGDTIERGASGNFTPAARRQIDKRFGVLLGLLDAVLGRVNNAYAALAQRVEAGRRSPAHERPPGLAAVIDGMQSLAKRYSFGTADTTPALDESELPKVRAPLFAFILSEELTRSFLPNFVGTLVMPIPGISQAIVVGLPIALFMFIVAVGQPQIGAYTERKGHRYVMRMGAGIAAAGFLATAFAVTVLDLLLWRSMCALGYAMVFVAAQGYVLDHSTTAERARSFAIFIGAIMVATVCGPSIGGLLADNIGMRPTFAVSAVLALGSLAAMRMLPCGRPAEGAASGRSKLPSLRQIGRLMLNSQFMTVTGLAAMPAKILLTGVLFYLVPMYIVSIGGKQAMAGRILMSYAVVMVLLGPITASLATDRRRMEWLVGGGLLVSGLGGVLMLVSGGVGWVFAATVLVGLGQAMSMAAQSALVAERCPDAVSQLGEHTVYGVYRLLERLGNALGPLIAGALVMTIGYVSSFVAIGAAVTVCGVAFLMTNRRSAQPAWAAA